MSDAEIRALAREATENPSRHALTKLRRARLRAGIDSLPEPIIISVLDYLDSSSIYFLVSERENLRRDALESAIRSLELNCWRMSYCGSPYRMIVSDPNGCSFIIPAVPVYYDLGTDRDGVARYRRETLKKNLQKLVKPWRKL